MRTLLACGGGFLLGVLWVDLMFDVLALGEPSATALQSIANHYARVAGSAWPMGHFVLAVMLGTLALAVDWLARDRSARRTSTVALALLFSPVALGLFRVADHARRLGAQVDSTAVQWALARSICLDHAACFALVAGFVAMVVLAERAEEAALRQPDWRGGAAGRAIDRGRGDRSPGFGRGATRAPL